MRAEARGAFKCNIFFESWLTPRIASRWILLLLAGMAFAGHSNAATVVMDFGTGSGASTPTTYTQNGITMNAVYDHFDLYGNSVGGTSTDNVAAIHNGNGGEGVKFTYNSGAIFDLLSVDVTEFLIRGAANLGTLTGTFTSSSGGSHSVTGSDEDLSAGIGVIDFSALGASWQGITYFTLTVPLGVDVCTFTCDIMGFDDVTIGTSVSPVPVPAALPLFLSALVGLGFLGRRRKRTTA